jgi:hypothetical protein
LVPKGTTGTDLLPIAGDIMPMFDTFIAGTDTFTASNTSNGLSLTMRLDPNLGLIFYNTGWMIMGGGWEFFSFFMKSNASLSLGANNDIPLVNRVLTDYTFTADITTSGPGVEFLYSLFDMNPVNASIPTGTPLGYLELMYTNHSRVTSCELTVDPPESINVGNIALWKWNETLFVWEQIPTAELATMLTINTDGTITISLPDVGDIHLIALTSTVPSGGPPGIPGYDMLVLFGVISLFSIVIIYTKRRRLLKM